MNEVTRSILKQLEQTSQEYWNISSQSGNFMNMLIKLMKAKDVLEIGTSNGYSGVWIADALKETGGH